MADENAIAEKSYQNIVSYIEEIAGDSSSTRDEKLKQISVYLAKKVPVFDWVGFYLVDPDADRELILGPYVGEETDHIRIPFGTGICGQAADTLDTFVVQDVSQEKNYLSCNINVKSEIVVPVMKNGKFIAELDIDSHTKDGITKEHQEMLEEICNIISVIF